MTDNTVNNGQVSQVRYPARVPRVEFQIYFALIFLAALPIVSMMWLWSLVSTQRVPSGGPLARAWREAQVVTPTIFQP